MVTSEPSLRQHSLNRVKTLSTHQIDNLETYLEIVERTLKNLDPNLYPHHDHAITQIKQTLTQIEVAHIKQREFGIRKERGK